MTLIKSISGIRGTIGGKPGGGLTPVDIARFSSAFGSWVKNKAKQNRVKIVTGRDARISGEMANRIVTGTLLGIGIDVADIGLTTTPTAGIAVTALGAAGGVMITASHNPVQWNALKLLDENGEFISASDGEAVLSIAEKENFSYSEIQKLGIYTGVKNSIHRHVEKILELPEVQLQAIKKAKLRIVVDAVNSTGGIAVPLLLHKLGVDDVVELHCKPDGIFPHDPEPLPANLKELSKKVIAKKAHLGFAVDPDVDRLAIVCENGEMFGEEYTLVAVADYVLSRTKGNTVSNLSSTMALKDITEEAGQKHYASAVGEVNVVEMMKANHAVIGGEGNGGVIYPALHYQRDALVGIALFLSHFALSGMSCSKLRATYPGYYINKNKINLPPGSDPDMILNHIKARYQNKPVTAVDGVKIYFKKGWIHLRKSNTEPAMRIISESISEKRAKHLAMKFIDEIKDIGKIS